MIGCNLLMALGVTQLHSYTDGSLNKQWAPPFCGCPHHQLVGKDPLTCSPQIITSVFMYFLTVLVIFLFNGGIEYQEETHRDTRRAWDELLEKINNFKCECLNSSYWGQKWNNHWNKIDLTYFDWSMFSVKPCIAITWIFLNPFISAS